MMKKIFTLILIITLSFSTVAEAYERKTYPYDNQQAVTKISNINAKEWRIPYIVLGAGSGTRIFAHD